MGEFLILALILGIATPVAAEGFSGRPESCEPISTAQRSDCEVENRYRCVSEEGSFYRIEFFETGGMTEVAQETSDFLPVSLSDEAGDGIFFTKVEGLHPRDMIQSGRSMQRLEGYISVLGLKQPLSAEVTFKATGQTITLADKSFETLEGQIVVKMPNAGATFTGRSIFAYQADIDIMIETESWTSLGPDETTYVREFALPGQPGFGDEVPRYGCGDLSQLELPDEEGKV
jgi:hypothetical protein